MTEDKYKLEQCESLKSEALNTSVQDNDLDCLNFYVKEAREPKWVKIKESNCKPFNDAATTEIYTPKG